MNEQKTELDGYTLWYDGVIQVAPEKLESLIMSGAMPEKLAVTVMTPEIEAYNRLADNKIQVKTELNPLSYEWELPPEYQDFDLVKYVNEEILAKDKIPEDALFEKRIDRLLTELDYYQNEGYIPMLATLVYVIDTLKKNRIVWGVGRGSSCASYLLYLMDVHSIDPIKFDIPIEEFLR